MSAPETACGTDRAAALTIVGIATGLGGMTAGAVHLMAQRDGGVAQRNDTLPEPCAVVSAWR